MSKRTCVVCGCQFDAYGTRRSTTAKFCTRKCRYSFTRKQCFDRRVDKTSSSKGCWLWIGGSNQHGRGMIFNGKANESCPRFAWKRVFGEIPNGLNALHKCDNPACVNPDHLFLGDHKANSRDMVEKGRHTFGDRAKQSNLKWDDVRAIRARYKKGVAGSGVYVLAREYGVAPTTIACIVRNKSWKESDLARAQQCA